MATCFENLVKHFELVIRRLEKLKRQDSVPEEEEEKIWELLNKAGDLCMRCSSTQALHTLFHVYEVRLSDSLYCLHVFIVRCLLGAACI